MNDIPWDDLQLFFHVARLGSLSAAANRTGVSPPTLGRRMLALERATGRALFIRKQTGYELASDGRALFDKVCAMQAAAQAIDGWQDRVQQMPIVVISAGTWNSRFLADNLPALWAPTDPFRLCFKTAEARVDFTYREADIGLRNERPQTGNIAARKSVDLAFAPYCTRDFNQERDCNWVALDTDVVSTPSTRWLSSQPNLWITVWANTPSMLLSLVKGGAGRTVLPCFIGDKDPDLVRAGPIIPELTHTSWIVMHDDERQRPEVREMIDRIAALYMNHERLFNGESG